MQQTLQLLDYLATLEDTVCTLLPCKRHGTSSTQQRQLLD
jgi:hypothetical protein